MAEEAAAAAAESHLAPGSTLYKPGNQTARPNPRVPVTEQPGDRNLPVSKTGWVGETNSH